MAKLNGQDPLNPTAEPDENENAVFVTGGVIVQALAPITAEDGSTYAALGFTFARPDGAGTAMPIVLALEPSELRRFRPMVQTAIMEALRAADGTH